MTISINRSALMARSCRATLRLAILMTAMAAWLAQPAAAVHDPPVPLPKLPRRRFSRNRQRT